ncbi:MAG: branched-chain amino acid transaminase [Leptospiraceae bacterium]|nr:branched-chain amino acid transaminase [Leptospiraceae bacterium]
MENKYKRFSYFEGKIVPTEDAKISIQTHAFQYGTAVFGGIRGYYNPDYDNLYIFRILEHYKRLINSTKIMQLNFKKSPEELVEITLDLVRKCECRENIYIRPIVYTSALELSPRFKIVPTEIAIYIIQLDDYLDTQKGLRLKVSSWRRLSDNLIPTISKASGGYVNSALAKSEAAQEGYDDAIFLDTRGMVSEASAANLFLVKNGELVTPGLSASVLEGITRRSIMQLAEDRNIKVRERDVIRSELYTSDEVFLSGTGVQVAWVKEIDQREVGDAICGKVTSELQSLFFNIVNNREEKYRHWLSPVY